MDYYETLEYLYSALPMYQRIGAAAYRADLGNALVLDEYFGHPHRSFRSIHVAGTNGKGSVCHMLTSVLMEQGLKVGLYTSPHLMDFRERIRINGQMISREFVMNFTKEHMKKFEEVQSSFFEMTVFMAFEYFRQEKVDIAVIETGMGGRLDTTNVITPILSVITNIGLDHTRFLGDSLEAIAREKAGIIKPGIPVIAGERQPETDPVFREVSAQHNSSLAYAGDLIRIAYSLGTTGRNVVYHLESLPVWSMDSLLCDLRGSYQKQNLTTTLATLLQLHSQEITISGEALRNGLQNVVRNTGLLGRWQEVDFNPLTVCDVGHNEAGFRYLTDQIRETPRKELFMLLGFVDDKPLEKLVRLLPSDAHYCICEPDIPRAHSAGEVEQALHSAGLKVRVFGSIGEAYEHIRSQAGPDDLIFIGGSTFLVADFLQWKKSEISF